MTYLNLWETKKLLEGIYRINYYLNSNVNIPPQNLRKRKTNTQRENKTKWERINEDKNKIGELKN